MFRFLLTLLAVGLVLYGLILFVPDEQAQQAALPAPLAKALSALRAANAPDESAAAAPQEMEAAAEPASLPPSDPPASVEEERAAPLLDPLPPLPPLRSRQPRGPSEAAPAPAARTAFIRNRPVPANGQPPDLTAADVLRDAPVVAASAAPAPPAPVEPMPRMARTPRYESSRSTDEVFDLNRENAALFDQLANLFEQH